MRRRRLVLLRHGQTAYNLGSRMQGQLDTELSELGRAQAVAAAEALGPHQPLRILSSDLQRAYQTAVVLAAEVGLSVQVDARLRETHLGEWQGLTHDQIDTIAPGIRLAWREDASWAPHGGESRIDVAARGMSLMAALVSQELAWGGSPEPDRPVILVAHGGFIAALSAALLRLPVVNWPVFGGMGNASWTQLSGYSAEDAGTDGVRWRLDVWNASAQVANDAR